MKEDALKIMVDIEKDVLVDQNHTRRVFIFKAGIMITISSLILTNPETQNLDAGLLIGVLATISLLLGLFGILPKVDERPNVEEWQNHINSEKEALEFCLEAIKKTIENNEINLFHTAACIKFGVISLILMVITYFFVGMFS